MRGAHALAEALGPSGGAASRCEHLSECRASRYSAHGRSRLQEEEVTSLACCAGQQERWLELGALSWQSRCAVRQGCWLKWPCGWPVRLHGKVGSCRELPVLA